MKNLKISIKDISNYDPENGETGGKYWFAETYWHTGIDQWEVSHSTSSIFRYCPYCGSFIGENSECSCMGEDYLRVNDQTLEAALSVAKGSPNYEIEFGTYTADEG